MESKGVVNDRWKELYEHELTLLQDSIIKVNDKNRIEKVVNETYEQVKILQSMFLKTSLLTEREKIKELMHLAATVHEKAAIMIADRIGDYLLPSQMTCDTNEDCKGLKCPKVIGLDTPQCSIHRCVCGPRIRGIQISRAAIEVGLMKAMEAEIESFKPS